MKFIAVLKDSLREAIDTKVFYVMVALSVLVTLFTFTLTFKPKPNAEKMMKDATAVLNADLSNLGGGGGDFRELLRRIQETKTDTAYDFVSGGTVDGAPDEPSSNFRAVVHAMPITPEATARLKESPDSVAETIRKNFGRVDDMHLVEVTDVRRIDRPEGAKKTVPGEAFFEVTAKPSPVTRRLWPHTFAIFFGAVQPFDEAAPLGGQLFVLENYVVGWAGASITILISIIITAFFIPNMLRKGTVDLLVVKPIHRPTLLIYKYVGGLTFIFLNTAVAVLGAWLALSVRSGIFAPGFLWMIPILTFSFAILYAVSTLFGVITRSAIVAILMTILAWFGLWIVDMCYTFVEFRRKAHEEWVKADERERKAREAEPAKPDGKNGKDGPSRRREEFRGPRIEPAADWFAKPVYVIHYILPRRGDLNTLTYDLLLRDLLTANQLKQQTLNDTPTSWGESLAVSMVFIGVFLGLSCWWFAAKDY